MGRHDATGDREAEPGGTRRDVARRVATVGYYCMVPNLYYRQGRIRHEFRDERGRMISLGALGFATPWAFLLLLLLPIWWAWRRGHAAPALSFSRVHSTSP